MHGFPSRLVGLELRQTRSFHPGADLNCFGEAFLPLRCTNELTDPLGINRLTSSAPATLLLGHFLRPLCELASGKRGYFYPFAIEF